MLRWGSLPRNFSLKRGIPSTLDCSFCSAQISIASQQPPSAAKTDMENKLKAQKEEMERQLLQSAQEILQQRIVSEPQNQQSDCAPSEDSDQPGHPPSLVRVFAVRMKKAWVLSYPLSAQRRLWSDWADAQADLSLHWVHSHFVGFFMSRLKCHTTKTGKCYSRELSVLNRLVSHH